MFGTLLILAASATGQTADPLAEARDGKIQCVTPNRETKTCAAISRYTVRPDGSFDSATTIMIAPSPLVTMDGGPVNSAMEQAIRAQVGASVAPMEGKKACAVDKADGDMLVAEATLDGVARPELNQRYIWVKPEDGYKIGQ